ncbi:MAG: TetR/AcrR family transcriptional regulator [Myxococcota bacterium]
MAIARSKDNVAEQVEDRRVRRTRRQLRDALVALILERGWDKVSVLDVCERADVGRSTFYVHFADKEDLLLSGFDDLQAMLEQQVQAAVVPFAFAEALCLHAAENHELFRAVAGRQSAQQIQWRFRDLVLALVEAELARLKYPKATRAAAARFVAGGFVEMLTGWLDESRSADAKQLSAAFRRLALAALKP